MNNNGLFYSFRGGCQSHTSYIQGEGEERQKNEIDKDFAPNSKFGSTDAKLVLGTSKRWGVSKLTYSYLRQQIGIVEQEDESQYLEPEQFTEEQRDREFEAPYQDVTNHIVSSENSILLPGVGSMPIFLSNTMTERSLNRPRMVGREGNRAASQHPHLRSALWFGW